MHLSERVSGRPHVAYDLQKMALDMAYLGWNQSDLARGAGLSHMTISRFFRGVQTAKTAKRLALALGYAPRRYVLRSDRAGVGVGG